MCPSAAEKSSFAAACAVRLAEEECRDLHSVSAHGKKIAQTFWGYSWCRNIETWQDYESRLPAGRSLLRAGAVIDLTIESSLITAYVADAAEEAVQKVRIPIQMPEESLLDELRYRCTGNIHSLADLMQGNLSEEILTAFCDPEHGIFPRHNELNFICTCLDDSCLCRHAAAALYGTGARLDDDPSLFFLMRGITTDLFFNTEAAAESLVQGTELDTESLSETFGIELEDL